MENKIEIFNNPDFGEIRTLLIDGIPYFVGKDVAVALGYANPRDALAKHVAPRDKKDGVAIRDSIGREQFATVINESGLYKLIFSSKLPKAQDFAHWVTSEVLPAIRKQGFYFLDNSKKNIEVYKKIAADPQFLIQVALTLQAEQEKVKVLTEANNALAAQNDALNKTVENYAPKVKYFDVILQCPRAVAVSLIAADYGMTTVKFNTLLKNLGIQYKCNGVWILSALYKDLGWTVTKTYSFISKSTSETNCSILTYWTQKGRAGLYELLKQKGILPVVEKEYAMFADDNDDDDDDDEPEIWF